MGRINLLHLITGLETGGAESLLVNIARKLDKTRFNVKIAYIWGPGSLAAEIRRAKISVFDLSRKGKLDPLVLIRLIFLLKREKIRILHTHLVHASIVGRVAAKLAGVTQIISTRHYGYYEREKSLINWLERKTAAFNSRFIAISESVKDYLTRKQKYDCEKVIVLHNAIDLNLFDSAHQVGVSKSGVSPVIGSVGRLHSSKGYVTLLRSMPYVIDRFPGVKLVIVGTGRERGRLDRLCAQLGIAGNVVFLGSVKPSEIPLLLRTFTAFVLASNWEGFGLAAVEAMASSLPLVASDVGGLSEIVQDGITGFLVPARRPRVLAQRIVQLLENPDLCLQMGNEGRRRAQALFSLDSMVKKLEDLYGHMLGRDPVGESDPRCCY